MFKKILAVLALLLLAFAGIAAMQPDTFSVSRSATIKAPAETLYAQVNDLHAWNAWSPWAKLDPNATNTFEGPGAGVGAVMRWAGNFEVGEGSMTITETKPGERVAFRLDFIKPMKGVSDAEFTFKEENGQTLVTWSMKGEHGFLGKAMGLIFNCEKMMNEQFDKGLANLAAVTEAEG